MNETEVVVISITELITLYKISNSKASEDRVQQRHFFAFTPLQFCDMLIQQPYIFE